jgi:hypothetical protein
MRGALLAGRNRPHNFEFNFLNRNLVEVVRAISISPLQHLQGCFDGELI